MDPRATYCRWFVAVHAALVVALVAALWLGELDELLIPLGVLVLPVGIVTVPITCIVATSPTAFLGEGAIGAGIFLAGLGAIVTVLLNGGCWARASWWVLVQIAPRLDARVTRSFGV